jgi:1,5-anhydro-D-fructose reductase (1,5-anhydro-D-mannitol-forming)
MAFGFAIVGTGRFASTRIVPALARAAGCAAVAVVSRDRGRAEAFAAEHGVPAAYDRLEDALADPRVDALWVATPHHLHRQAVEAAAAARKHVLCEKPLATTVEDARAMVYACRQAGVALGTGFHLRHHPLHREVRRLVAAGALGEVLSVEGEWSLETPGTGGPAWRRDPAMSGGGIGTGTGVHVIDLMRFVLDDEVAAVSAFTDAEPDPHTVEQRLVGLLRFRRGAYGLLRCLRPAFHPANDLVVQGTRARLAARSSIDELARGRLEAVGADPDLTGVPAGTDLYALEAQAFARAALSGEEPDASGWDGLVVQIALAALYESARSGRRIEVVPVR